MSSVSGSVLGGERLQPNDNRQIKNQDASHWWHAIATAAI
jgi:hypothetical protein